jgi:hypothetical protein
VGLFTFLFNTKNQSHRQNTLKAFKNNKNGGNIMIANKKKHKQEIEKSLKEYHSKYAKRDLEICEGWKQIDKETGP